MAEAVSTSDPLCLHHLMMERMGRKFPGGDSAHRLCPSPPQPFLCQMSGTSLGDVAAGPPSCGSDLAPAPALPSHPGLSVKPRAQTAAPAGRGDPLGIQQGYLPLPGHSTF